MWKAVRKGSILTTNERTNLSMIEGDDIMVVDIRRRGEEVIRIIIIYDQRARETGRRPARRLDWQQIIRRGGGGGMVLTGDFNAHSQY